MQTGFWRASKTVTGSSLRRAARRRKGVVRPLTEMTDASSMATWAAYLTPRVSRAAESRPAALNTATTAPIEAPESRSIWTCKSSSARSTPMCAYPGIPPELRARPSFCFLRVFIVTPPVSGPRMIPFLVVYCGYGSWTTALLTSSTGLTRPPPSYTWSDIRRHTWPFSTSWDRSGSYPPVRTRQVLPRSAIWHNVNSSTQPWRPRVREGADDKRPGTISVSYTHLRAHETRHDLVC